MGSLEEKRMAKLATKKIRKRRIKNPYRKQVVKKQNLKNDFVYDAYYLLIDKEFLFSYIVQFSHYDENHQPIVLHNENFRKLYLFFQYCDVYGPFSTMKQAVSIFL